ncbi:MAG: S41 family peptidase [Myxococcota bacterium]
MKLAPLALSGIVSCLHAGAARAAPKPYSPYAKLDVFARVLAHVENHHVAEIDEEKLIDAAIRGMLASLDPHTTYLTPSENRSMHAETKGEFGGIGLEVEFRDGGLVVVSPIEGTPADRAGLRTGDRLVAIDGATTKGLLMADVLRLIRGPAGSKVALTLMRDAWPEPRDVTLTREIIQLVSVTSRALEPGIGYLRIKSFPERTEHALREEMEKLLGASGGALRGLVLDLRNNPGGLLDQAVRVADAFVESGLLVRTVGRGGRVLDEEKAHRKDTYVGFPMVALVNAGTASAAEIVAGALQDHARAVIVGSPTFGKGSVQTIIDFDDGSALKLTVARYTTPSGKSIQERGIAPDVLVEDARPPPAGAPVAPAVREKDLAGHLRFDGASAEPPPEAASARPTGRAASAREAGPASDDPHVRRAVEILRAYSILRSTP